jgi:putative endonuclease
MPLKTDTFNHLDVGRDAETDAKKYLENHGLRLIETNYRCLRGEIDLIMQDNEYLVFIEVRSRTNIKYGNAIESINHSKKRKIILAAMHYLQKSKLLYTATCRFDIIAIHPVEGTTRLEWLKNAFTLDS